MRQAALAAAKTIRVEAREPPVRNIDIIFMSEKLSGTRSAQRMVFYARGLQGAQAAADNYRRKKCGRRPEKKNNKNRGKTLDLQVTHIFYNCQR